ncbi:MAG: aspartyl protease family protein [Candidatus Methylomirabilota bacterium]
MPEISGLRIWLLGLAAAGAFMLAQSGAGAQTDAFREGVEFFQGGHYRWALEKFIEAVDRTPRDPQRQWYLAESYRLVGDATAAAHGYRRILELAPQSEMERAARQALEDLGEPARITIQVPIQKRGASILVPATVNGQPVGYFILDTGATFTTVNRQTAGSLGISSRGSSVHLATASGVIQAPLVLLDEMNVAGAHAQYVPAVIHDLPNAPSGIVGLLGLSFLERFRVSLDMSSGVLLLESGN